MALTRSSAMVILATFWPTRSWKPQAVVIDMIASSTFLACSLSA